MKIFEGSDIVEFAIRMEENGERFYRRAATTTADEEIKSIFNRLADEEVKHKRFFSDIFSNMEKYAPPETFPGEYMAYLRDYIDGKSVFTEEKEAELSDVKGTLAALEFALQRELDSVLYYHEIKRFVSDSQHPVINGIIEEEWRHFRTLSKAREKYK
jgi:rubrerythrin